MTSAGFASGDAKIKSWHDGMGKWDFLANVQKTLSAKIAVLCFGVESESVYRLGDQAAIAVPELGLELKLVLKSWPQPEPSLLLRAPPRTWSRRSAAILAPGATLT
jgi:hypothetical protein